MAFHGLFSMRCALAGLVALSACRMNNPAFGMTDGETGSGGNATAGGSTAATNGNGPGGTSVGSASATGGSATAGSATVGSATAGSATAGSATEGSTTVGSATAGDGPGPYCGDGIVTPPEECEPGHLGGATCNDQNFSSGTPVCSANCTLDYSPCYTCGDGKVTGPEVCDGDKINGATCESLGNNFHGPGTPSCSADCLQLSQGDCGDCGNGVTEAGEDCDTGDIPADCEELGLGFDGGELNCTTECTFDTSSCATCNNGIVEPGEECDTFNLPNGDACSDYLDPGNYQGTPVCTPECTVNLDSCCLSLGEGCTNDGQCCTGYCNPMTDVCDANPCLPPGASCTDNAACCSGQCVNNKCSAG